MLRSVTHIGDVFSLAYHGSHLRGALFDVADTAAIIDMDAWPSISGSLPRSLWPPVARLYLRHAVISNGSTHPVTAYPGIDSLYVRDQATGRMRTIAVPVRQRRGGSAALLRLERGGARPPLDPDTVPYLLPDTHTTTRHAATPPRSRESPSPRAVPCDRADTIGHGRVIGLRISPESPDRTVATLTDSSVLVQLVDDANVPKTHVREFRLPGVPAAPIWRTGASSMIMVCSNSPASALLQQRGDIACCMKDGDEWER